MTTTDTNQSPIALRFGDEVLQYGFAAVPQLFLRFYRYLEHEGERLDDREAMLIVHALARQTDIEAPAFQLRDLRSATPLRTREKYLAKLRRMGLVFTRRVYRPFRPPALLEGLGRQKSAPRLDVVEWDLSNLFHNLLRVAEQWQARQERQETVYRLPDDYCLAVTLAPEVAQALRERKYDMLYVPQDWKYQAGMPTEEQPGLPGLAPAPESRRQAQPRHPLGQQPDETMQAYRERVLNDLRRKTGNRRAQVAILTQQLGALIGLGLEPGGRVRTRPAKSDYARVGQLMREQGGPVRLWQAACRIAATQTVRGEPLDYLQECLIADKAQRRRPSARDDDRDDYPEAASGYSDSYLRDEED